MGSAILYWTDTPLKSQNYMEVTSLGCAYSMQGFPCMQGRWMHRGGAAEMRLKAAGGHSGWAAGSSVQTQLSSFSSPGWHWVHLTPSPLTPAQLTWRRWHSLQAGIGTAIVAAAPVSWALRVSLAARGLAGPWGQCLWGRWAAVCSGLPGSCRCSLFSL